MTKQNWKPLRNGNIRREKDGIASQNCFVMGCNRREQARNNWKRGNEKRSINKQFDKMQFEFPLYFNFISSTKCSRWPLFSISIGQIEQHRRTARKLQFNVSTARRNFNHHVDILLARVSFATSHSVCEGEIETAVAGPPGHRALPVAEWLPQVRAGHHLRTIAHLHFLCGITQSQNRLSIPCQPTRRQFDDTRSNLRERNEECAWEKESIFSDQGGNDLLYDTPFH